MEEGYHGRNAPHGNNPAEAEEAHLSALDATHLAALANQTGLAYSTLHKPDSLSAILNASQFSAWQASVIDLRPWLAILCFIMAVLYLVPQRWYQPIRRFVLLRRKNEVFN
jgi:mxaL protein